MVPLMIYWHTNLAVDFIICVLPHYLQGRLPFLLRVGHWCSLDSRFVLEDRGWRLRAPSSLFPESLKPLKRLQEAQRHRETCMAWKKLQRKEGIGQPVVTSEVTGDIFLGVFSRRFDPGQWGVHTKSKCSICGQTRELWLPSRKEDIGLKGGAV